jgi:hypothetical protein
MGSVQDFKFNDMCRMGSEICSTEQSDMQNAKTNDYLLTNHFISDSQMTKTIAFATSHPNMNYKGSHHTSLGGSNIDTNSELLVKQEQTKEHAKLALLERPYLTIPYLGRGKVDPNIESQLIQGEYYTNRKSTNLQSEVSFMPYSNTPLLDSVETSIANPANFVESNDSGMLRSAVGTRDVNRDISK